MCVTKDYDSYLYSQCIKTEEKHIAFVVLSVDFSVLQYVEFHKSTYY